MFRNYCHQERDDIYGGYIGVNMNKYYVLALLNLLSFSLLIATFVATSSRVSEDIVVKFQIAETGGQKWATIDFSAARYMAQSDDIKARLCIDDECREVFQISEGAWK